MGFIFGAVIGGLIILVMILRQMLFNTEVFVERVYELKDRWDNEMH